MRSDQDKWDEYYGLIMDAIDIEDTCRSWGLEFDGSTTAQGWAVCHATNRPDKNASAGVNIITGYYNDMGPGPSYPFFQLGVEMGPYSSYSECANDLAKQNKLLSKKPKGNRGQSFHDKVKPSKWHPVMCKNVCKKLNITPDILLMVGASMGMTNSGDLVVRLPVYDPEKGFEAAEKGAVLLSADGGTVTRYKGKGALPEQLKNMSIGNAGIMNKHAIHHWHEAKVIYKVEGISDMLTLQAKIPEEHRNTHLVVTNSDGCDARTTSYHFSAMARNKTIIIIHDADEPGQFGNSMSKDGGAVRWENDCIRTAKRVANVQLPYDIAEKKGKDLRDWFNEGHNYNDLAELVKNTKVSERSGQVDEDVPSQGLTEHQLMLRRIGLVVLGHDPKGHIVTYNANECRKFIVENINKLTYHDLGYRLGDATKENIADPMDGDADDSMISVHDMKSAIAFEASGKELSRTNTIGVGLWESNGRLFAIGTGEWLAVNGGVKSYSTPTIDDKIVDFGQATEEWYDSDLLFPFLEEAKSPEWRKNHIEELSQVFKRWDNISHPNGYEILSCLAIATWGQALWNWRPWVSVIGESSAGKTVMMDFIAAYFGHNFVVATANASEAGIRNTIGNTSKPLMIDEFEASPDRNKILGMLMASSRRGAFGKSLRSNSSQGSVQSEYQLIPWFSAIEMKADKQAERNRYITFELQNRDGKEYFDVPSAAEINVLRNKSIAVIMRTWARVQELSRIIMKALSKDYSRQSESYALPTAVYGAACGWSDERVIAHHKKIMEDLRDNAVVEADEPEQFIVLATIMSSRVPVGGGTSATIGELLGMDEMTNNGYVGNPERILNQFGVKRYPVSQIMVMADWKRAKNSEDGAYVYIDTASGGQVRRAVLKGTDHQYQSLKTLLGRLPGAYKGHAKINGTTTQGIFVPARLMSAIDNVKIAPSEIDKSLTGDLDNI